MERNSKEAKALASKLAMCFCTENYTRVYPGLLITSGVRLLAEEAGAFWLLDVIESIRPRVSKEDGFAVAELSVSENDSAVFRLTDGNENELYKQEIQFTDFPFDNIKLFVALDEIIEPGKSNWVVLLPSEY